MDKIELFKKEDGSVWFRYRGKESPISQLNVPLFAQLYKQLGQMPSFSYPLDDVELNVLAKTLTEKIKQTALRLYQLLAKNKRRKSNYMYNKYKIKNLRKSNNIKNFYNN